MPIDVKEAVTAAAKYARDLYGSEIAGPPQLEEVELATENGIDVWRVTLGIYLPEEVASQMDELIARANAMAGGKTHSKRYKAFTVDATTGVVRSMRIREL